MLGPSRPLPQIGAPARVAHFGGGFEAATVVGLDEHGRSLRVSCESGELLDFVLSPATARFISAEGTQGPRLELLDAKH